MLRCPPSRITLTSSDLRESERRFAARQSARFIDRQKCNIRLSSGPSHQTKLAIVPEDNNLGRKRAASSSSQVTVCSIDDDESFGEIPIAFVTSPADAQSKELYPMAQPAALDDDIARASEDISLLQQTPSKPLSDSRERQTPLTDRPSSQRVGLNVSTINETQPPMPASLSARQLPISRRGLPVLAEIHRDGYPISSPTRAEPALLSSARARRRNARSNDEAICCDLPVRPRPNEADPHNDFAAHQGRSKPQLSSSVPQVTVSMETDGTQGFQNPALDPGAPVFIPRTRFGTATQSSGGEDVGRDTRWNSQDSSESLGNLRIRPASEQNIDPAARHESTARGSRTSESGASRPRRNGGASSGPLPRQAPNLERYPPLRLPIRSAGRRSPSGSRVTVPVFERGFSTSPSAALPGAYSVTERERQTFHAEGGCTDSRSLDGAVDQGRRLHNTWPDPSSSSLSIPDQVQAQPPQIGPQIESRSSSLAWNQVASPDARRVPSMVSAASGISGTLSSGRHSSAEALDAAAEFLRMRNSPLDELTERLSRLSGRPRSVGRSWERDPASRGRISLLAGDLFRQEQSSSPTPAPDAPVSHAPTDEAGTSGTQISRTAKSPGTQMTTDATVSSPVLSSPPALPSTPPFHNAGSNGPRSPLVDKSPDKARRLAESALKRKPVHATAVATPRVKVYHDADPPNAQPQTPADIHRSSRRARGRSDTVVQQTSDYPAHGPVDLPSVGPERHPHRNTYPSAATGVRVDLSSATTSFAEQAIRQMDSQRGSQESENDFEGQLHGLEEDRRIWLSRQGRGSLDTTPPTEGRFERYLS